MKVYELIELLQGTDKNANVKLAVNPRWPFECEISHVYNKSTLVYIVDSNNSLFIDIDNDMDIFQK